MLNGRILRRHAKGIKAHGMQHIKAPHGAEPGYNVADRIIANMAHVQVSGGIRKHFQYIGFWLCRIHFAFKGLVLFPVLLPLFFNGMGSIFFFQHIFNLPGLNNSNILLLDLQRLTIKLYNSAGY